MGTKDDIKATLGGFGTVMYWWGDSRLSNTERYIGGSKPALTTGGIKGGNEEQNARS